MCSSDLVGTEVAQIVPLDQHYVYQLGQGVGSQVVILRDATHMEVQFIKGEVLNVIGIGSGGSSGGVTIYRPRVDKESIWLHAGGRGDWWQRVFPGTSLSLVGGNASTSGFSIDSQTGTLSIASVFDFEKNASSINLDVLATKQGMHELSKAFTFTISDVFEDLDQDGTADHLDDDMDGDGFTNAEELA